MLEKPRSELLAASAVLAAASLGLYAASLYSYLLFHSLVEVFTIAIGFALFGLAWNARRFLPDSRLELMGIGFGLAGVIDLLHTLAYKGMGVFPTHGANLATQLWIAARSLQAATLCAAPLFSGRRVDQRWLVAIPFAVFAALVGLVFSGHFPACYIEGKGLTPFKIISEYAIVAVLLTSLLLFSRTRMRFEPKVHALIVSSIVCSAASEILFTAYVSVFGFANLLGHLLKLCAFYFLYRALLVTGIREPFNLVFRELKQSEEGLQRARQALEQEIQVRLAELQASEEKFLQLIRKLQVGVVIHGADTQILTTNTRAQEILGLSRERLAGKAAADPDWHFFREDGTVLPVEEYPVNRVLATGRPLRDMVTRVHRSPETQDAWVLVSADPILDQRGGATQVIVTFVDISERKRAEQERLAHLRFLQCMDRVNRAMQVTGLEQMTRDVLDAVLSSLECDRAFLLYPCDPSAAVWSCPLERTNPRVPGVLDLGLQMPMDPDVAQELRLLLASDGPVKFGPGAPHPLSRGVSERFGCKCVMSMAIHPKVGRPWQFGIHQCSHARVWTAEEERLFQEIGRRLADGLSMLLAYRDLQETREKLEEAQRIAHIGYWERDFAARRVTLSDEACRAFGVSNRERVLSSEELDEEWSKGLHPDDRARVSQAHSEALKGGARYDVEYRAVQPGGEVRFLHAEANVRRDGAGRLSQMLGMVQDITEQKLVEQALRDSEQRYRMVFENSPISIWEEDFSEVKAFFDELRKQGVAELGAYLDLHPQALRRCAELAKIVDVNRAALALLSAADKRALLAGLVSTFTPESFEMFQEELVCLWNGETEMVRDAVVKTFTGDLRDVTVCFTVCPGYEGTLSRVLVSLSDITARKVAENEIRLLNRDLERRVVERTAQLEAANKELEAFAYSVAHDLRAPVRHISGYAALLRRRGEAAVDKVGRRYMDVISRSAERMAQLIDDLLSFSRMGRSEMSRKQVDLGALVRRVIDELSPEAAGRTVRWRLGELPSVRGDQNMLYIVMVNLLSNALKFTRPKPAAEIEVGSHVGDGETLVFVRDNGVGFDPTYANKLFGVFQRLHSSEEFEGTGIGLASVRRIITRHGGRTWAEGAVNQGAALFFSLPERQP